MPRGPLKCIDYGIYMKLTGEELRVELEENPDSDGYVCVVPIQCKTLKVANACIDEYIKIGRIEADREYEVRRRFAA